MNFSMNDSHTVTESLYEENGKDNMSLLLFLTYMYTREVVKQ